MPETRFIEEVSYDPSLKASERILANATIKEIPYEISDEQLADEAEERALAKADQLIDAITNLAEAKVFLKRLVARLIKKGYLP